MFKIYPINETYTMKQKPQWQEQGKFKSRHYSNSESNLSESCINEH